MLQRHNLAFTVVFRCPLSIPLFLGWLLVVFHQNNNYILFISVWAIIWKCFLWKWKILYWAASIIQSMVQFKAVKDTALPNTCHFLYNQLMIVKIASLKWTCDVLHFWDIGSHPTKLHSNNIDDSVNDVVMVIVNNRQNEDIIYTYTTRTIW